MLLDMIYVVVGLAGLFLGGNWLVRGASRLAASLNISPLIIGVTVVAFGTSAPELLVCLQAAARGSSDIAVGNIVGSNIANIGLILGVSGILITIPIHITLIKREIPVMIGASILVYMMALDGQINQLEGLLLFGILLGFTAVLIYLSRQERLKPREEQELAAEEGITGSINRWAESGRLVVGLIVLVVGSDFLVDGAVHIAQAFGVSQIVIGLTLVAVGTSLPELVTAIVAARKRHDDILFGNIIGSCIFNLLGILGLTALITPIGVAPKLPQFDMLVMIAFAVVLLPFSMDRMLRRHESALMLAAYSVFILLAVVIV